MTIHTREDAGAFQAALDRCKGPVWMESPYGDQYNLKSTLSQYLAICEVFRNRDAAFRLFAVDPGDQTLLARFI